MYVPTGPINDRMQVERGRIAIYTRRGLTEQLVKARKRLELLKAIRLLDATVEIVGETLDDRASVRMQRELAGISHRISEKLNELA